MKTDDEKQHIYWETQHKFRSYDHPIVEFFAKQRINYVTTFLDLSTIDNALDVGCGDGFSTWYMYHHIPNIWAIDRSFHMLSRHPLRKIGVGSIADAQQLPFPDNSFDLVYGWEILHHVYEPERVIAEMARVSRQWILVAEPNRANPAQFAFALWDREHRWVLRYTLGYMQHIFEMGGLQIEHASQGGCVFPNVTPPWLMPFLRQVPYQLPIIGISNWVLGSKAH